MKTGKYLLFDLGYVALSKIALTTNVPNNSVGLSPTNYCACWHDYSTCLHNRIKQKKSQYHNVAPHQGVGSPFQMKKIKSTLTSKTRRGDSQKPQLGSVRGFSEVLWVDQTFQHLFFILQVMPRVLIQNGHRARLWERAHAIKMLVLKHLKNLRMPSAVS